MPRKNPSECIEHRITLGTYERKEFKEFIDAKTALAKAESAVKTGCLLYTSPSPRDVEESRMPSSA